MPGQGGTVTGSNMGASKETDEPNHAGTTGGKSVWWTWTATASETVTVDTIGSDFDTVLAVYTGTAVDALSQIASDDDEGGNATSRLTIAAVAGTSYPIVVDGYGGNGGLIRLNVSLTDSQPPAVSITNLSGGQIVTSSPVNVSGTASDLDSPSSGLAVVEVRVNGGDFQITSGTTNWGRSVNVSLGSNLIEARSQDNAGNYSALSPVTVIFTPPDTIAPTVVISSPTSGQNLSSTTIDVSGTAADNASVTTVEVRVNGGPWQTAIGAANWTRLVNLNSGSNLIEARSRDGAGNYSVIATVTTNNDLGKRQTVSAVSQVNVTAGTTFGFGVQYGVTDEDTTLSGLGLRIHFDSSKLTWQSFANVLAAGETAPGTYSPQNDTEDFDNDPATDKFVLVDWASVAGTWPNQKLPTLLYDANFIAGAEITAGVTTTIRFSASRLAGGYSFASNPVFVGNLATTIKTRASGEVTIEFYAAPDARYTVEYSTNINGPYLTTLPAVTGTGSRVQWVDNGPPRTASKPIMEATSRFYRVVQTP